MHGGTHLGLHARNIGPLPASDAHTYMCEEDPSRACQVWDFGKVCCVCRMREAMALQLAGSSGGRAPVQAPDLVGDFLGQAHTPRWLGDPYGVDEQGTQVMGPDRVSLPNIAARSRSDSPSDAIPGSPCR